MIPFCRTLKEADLVLAELAKNGLARGSSGLEVYVMCEIPNNVILADQSEVRTLLRTSSAPMQTSLRLLAIAVEFSHGLMMVLWGLGLPLLLWHRFERLSRLYMWLSLAFVVGSLVSHQLLGECMLTTLARYLWQSAGVQHENVPFIVRFTNQVARIRPSTRAAVLVWEAAIALYCIAFLWGQKRLLPRPRPHGRGNLAAEDAKGGPSGQC